MGMGMTMRTFWLMVHLGLAFLFIHSFAGGLAGLYLGDRFRRLNAGTWIMALTSWLTVIIGTWIVYPWYRAQPPAGADLAAFPRSYLLAHAELAEWHRFGMEWKEHVGWLAPFLATAVAFVVVRYGVQLQGDTQVRKALTLLFSLAFGTALVSGVLGGLLNKVAPNSFLLQ